MIHAAGPHSAGPAAAISSRGNRPPSDHSPEVGTGATPWPTSAECPLWTPWHHAKTQTPLVIRPIRPVRPPSDPHRVTPRTVQHEAGLAAATGKHWSTRPPRSRTGTASPPHRASPSGRPAAARRAVPGEPGAARRGRRPPGSRRRPGRSFRTARSPPDSPAVAQAVSAAPAAQPAQPAAHRAALMC